SGVGAANPPGLDGGDGEEAGADAEEGAGAIEQAEDDRCEETEADELSGAADCLADGVGQGEFVAGDEGGVDGAFGAWAGLGCRGGHGCEDVGAGDAAFGAQEVEGEPGPDDVAEKDEGALGENIGGGAGDYAGDGGWDNEREDEGRTEEGLACLFRDEED